VTEPETTAADGVTIRRAVPADAPAVADVFIAAIKSTYDFPLAHTDDECRAWLAEEVVPLMETWVAEVAGRVVAMMVLDEAGIGHLYVDPPSHSRGIGSRLVELAKDRRPDSLELYTFQVNERARRFYEWHGFAVVTLGDGSGNEERQPDVLYRWQP
jgi:ribosomal protein S18 acetylase RimI-like enzyme